MSLAHHLQPARRPLPRRPRRRGFTLVEVAVTIVIVGIGLTLVLQAMGAATGQAAQTRNVKVARDLGLLTLGRIASGLYREDLRERFYGTYAEDGYPEFEFEVALGDEVFEEEQAALDDNDRPFYDSWNDPDKLDDEESETEEDEETTQPYEKIKVRVVFPKLYEYKNTLILESWVPWEQVYGPEEDDETAAPEDPA